MAIIILIYSVCEAIFDSCKSKRMSASFSELNCIFDFIFENTSNVSLTPGKEYYYQVGDENGWSDMYQFTASPGPNPSVTTRIIAYGGEDNCCMIYFKACDVRIHLHV